MALKSWLAFIVPSLSLITPRPGMLEDFGRLTPWPAYIFPNKAEPNVPNTMPGNPPFVLCFIFNYFTNVFYQ